MDAGLQVKFWGVRGSIPTPAPGNLGFGGNTTCLEILTSEGRMIIDAGSGIRNLGLAMQRETQGDQCSILLLMTHFHWDHIQGLPFFVPLYLPSTEVTFVGSESPERLKVILEGQMEGPYFPVGFEFLAARRRFLGSQTDIIRHGSVSIYPFALNHPQRATGYRIEHNGRAIVHASDLEHGDAQFDRILRDSAQSADILIIDAQYTPEEYESKHGWGHSTWLEATCVAKDCGVKQLVLFHHDPAHDDEFIGKIEECARKKFENTIAAREGCTLKA